LSFEKGEGEEEEEGLIVKTRYFGLNSYSVRRPMSCHSLCLEFGTAEIKLFNFCQR